MVPVICDIDTQQPTPHNPITMLASLIDRNNHGVSLFLSENAVEAPGPSSVDEDGPNEETGGHFSSTVIIDTHRMALNDVSTADADHEWKMLLREIRGELPGQDDSERSLFQNAQSRITIQSNYFELSSQSETSSAGLYSAVFRIVPFREENSSRQETLELENEAGNNMTSTSLGEEDEAILIDSQAKLIASVVMFNLAMSFHVRAERNIGAIRESLLMRSRALYQNCMILGNFPRRIELQEQRGAGEHEGSPRRNPEKEALILIRLAAAANQASLHAHLNDRDRVNFLHNLIVHEMPNLSSQRGLQQEISALLQIVFVLSRHNWDIANAA